MLNEGGVMAMARRVLVVPRTECRTAGPILLGERCSRYCGHGNRRGLLGVGGWVFPHFPLGRDVSGPPSAMIGEAVNVVVPVVFAVSAYVSPCDGAFFENYGIEAVDFSCEFSVAGRCDDTHRTGGSEFAVRSDDTSAAG